MRDGGGREREPSWPIEYIFAFAGMQVRSLRALWWCFIGEYSMMSVYIEIPNGTPTEDTQRSWNEKAPNLSSTQITALK
ncbi:hypothetical protein QG37_07120 [Candidozyma auris]|nr:hypothetical protein QG37_07120 [[Candida] auris]